MPIPLQPRRIGGGSAFPILTAGAIHGMMELSTEKGWDHMVDWKARLAELQGEIYETRHWLHQHPELPFQEAETTRFVKERLAEYGVEVLEFPALHTGAAALIRGGRPGPTLALREDIDALPIQENTGLPFASCRPGVSHACGHDVHTAALLYAAKVLYDLRAELAGDVLLLFQCAEENGSGAYQMLEAGVLASIKPQAVVGFHCDPKLEVGTIGLRHGPSNASFDIMSWTITGQGGHGAYPHQCVDPIVVSAHLITQLQTLVSRRNLPTHPAVLTIGEIHGGSAPNIIPNQVTMRGAMRAFDPAIRQQLLEEIQTITREGCRALGAEGGWTHDVGIPAIYGHPDIAERVAAAAERCLGPGHICQLPEPTMGSDDFSVWLEACGGRGLQFRVGTWDPARPNTNLGLHVAENYFVDEALSCAVPVLVQFTLDYLAQ